MEIHFSVIPGMQKIQEFLAFVLVEFLVQNMGGGNTSDCVARPMNHSVRTTPPDSKTEDMHSKVDDRIQRTPPRNNQTRRRCSNAIDQQTGLPDEQSSFQRKVKRN